MKNLKAFILGGLSILIFIPIIEQVCEVIITALEYIKGLVSIPVLKINNKILDLQSAQEEINTVVMGFQHPDSEEEYEDEDDFEDKKRKKLM